MPKPNQKRIAPDHVFDAPIGKLPNKQVKTKQQLEEQGCLRGDNCIYPRCECYKDLDPENDLTF